MARCFDTRVLIGLGAVAVLGFVVAPGFAVAALPVLIGLACPLSMLVMMRRRGADRGGVAGPAAEAELAQLREEVAALTAARAGRPRTVARPIGGQAHAGDGSRGQA